MAATAQSRSTRDAARLAPVERKLADIGAWRFVALEGVPPIRRKTGTFADQRRMSFLRSVLPHAGRVPMLADYAANIGRTHGVDLSGHPDAFSNARQDLGPSWTDLVSALGVLMRVGLLVVDGIGQPGVTRSRLQISLDGRTFVCGEEGDGSRMYWPESNISGVTIGPGYDMGGRSPQEVAKDLAGIGVAADRARQIGIDAAGKIGADAGTYVVKHKDDVVLKPIQQTALFDKVVPKYEALVRSSLPASLVSRLFQHEFDAILSLAWNTSRFGRYGVNRDIGRLDMVAAAQSWRTLIGGGPGISGRRARETAMFENGVYLVKRPVGPRRHSGLDASGGSPV